MTPEQKLLMKAAKLIEQRGWSQSEYETTKGCLCMMGAIRAAASKNSKAEYSDKAAKAGLLLADFLGSNFPFTGYVIFVNDHQYTDPTQAICALTGAAMMEI